MRNWWRSAQGMKQTATPEGGRAAAPTTSQGQLAKERLWIFGLPTAIRLLVLLVAVVLLFPWLHSLMPGRAHPSATQSARLLLLYVVGPLLLVACWQQWRHARLAAEPRYEAALNHRAMEWLAAHDDFDRVKLEAEVPRESVYLPGWRARWLLVTNRRVLLFVASARERHLVSEWTRRSVMFAGAPDELPGATRRPLWRRLLWPGANLAVTFGTGSTLHLRCASDVTASRASQVLMAGGGPVDTYMVTPASDAGSASPRRR
jgi:hypothetical protein